MDEQLTKINIKKDFDAKKFYEGMVFYSRAKHNQNKIEYAFSADRVNHEWEQETYKFKDLNTCAKLKLITHQKQVNNKGLVQHTLEIEFSGEQQARQKTLKRIQGITGIKIK